ncbi:uncharacterized protein LOC132815894 isoform X2 [Hemiscyllium ocellatum]|uniref:uncharacterized protein LOC132815894 isoform X2 n=1 Tax=Hemiscyllium ocellatum TaxID=170820 RepID=UPI002966388F|nr:uncharacterized protein LOC132815894 isoform X2 [Hemiscyllium ocellatum]
MDSETDRPGTHSPVGNGKFETTKSPIRYCPPVRPTALTSCPVAEAGESPESPARTVPLPPSPMGAAWHGGQDSPVTHGWCQEGAPMSENAAEIKDEFRNSGETADAPSADSTEESSRKKVCACTGSTGDCESSVCNPSLLREASAPAHFGVTTLTELSVTTNNSVLLSESVSVQRSDLTSSVPVAWPVTQEAYPTADTGCGSDSELSGGNDQAAGWHDEPQCLGAADTDQFEQAMPHTHDEVPEVGLSGTEGTQRTQFLLVHGGKAETVEGVLVQPSFSDSQRIELEDPVEEQSEDESIAEELMLRPDTPENRELQSHSPLVKELNLNGRELPLSLGLCRGAEQEESTMTGVLGDGASCCSMEETQLTGREGAEGAEDEICSGEHAVQPELTPGRAQVRVCQEEGLVWITAAPRIQPQLFTAAVLPRPGGRETGGVSQKQLKTGEQSTPASSEKDVLVEEKSGEIERSRILEEPAGLLELCVGVCRAREQAGSPTAPPSTDTRQQCVQYDLEMDSSKRENPKAESETGLLDKVSGEGSIPVSQFPETLDSYRLEGRAESSEQSASGHVTPCEPVERNDLSEQTASEEEEASNPAQLTCIQLPGTLSDSALPTVENEEELNIIMGKANLDVSPPSPDCTDVREVNLSLPTSIRNKGDPVQTSRTVTPCTSVPEDERLSEETCPPTGFSEESIVFGEGGAEDLELDDEQLARKHHSHLPPDHRKQRFIFSKDAEDQSAGEGMPRRGDSQTVQGTLDELGLCTQREMVPQTSSTLQNGVVPTHSDYATNVSGCKDSRTRSQQGTEVQKPSDGILKKYCPENRGVEQETETVALGERGQFQQEENVAQPSLLGEEHGAVMPQTLDRIPFGETPIQLPVSPNLEAESVPIEWQDMRLDGTGKCQVIVESTDLAETGAADISRTDGVVKVGSTIVSSEPKYLNLQPSESQLKREDITSKSLNSQMNLNSRPSKRLCEGEEALGSKSTASSPSKRVCLPQQAGTEGLASAEGQNVTLLSLSAEQRQHQAWYIGRLVQQFVTEYRASQECRATGEVRAVSRQDEVRRIVREFFKTQVAKPKEPLVDLPQQNVEMGDSDQCHHSENSEPRQEPRETSDDKSPGFMGSSSDCGPGTNGSGSSTSTEPSPLLSPPSSKLVNWHVGAWGDSESSLEKAGKLARKTGTVQETAEGDTFHVMSPDPSNCVPGDTDPTQEVTVAEGSHPSLSLTEESGTNVEAFDASRASWSSLAHRSPNADSQEGLENGGLGTWESQATPAGGDGTAVTASNKMGSSQLEILRAATGSLSCAVLECDGEAETDSGSADQGVADVTGGCCSHSSSTDKSSPPPPALPTSPEANGPGQPGEMRCLSLAEPSSPGDSSNCSQDVIESCNPMELPPSSHNNPGHSYNVGERRVNVDGVESDHPPPPPPPLSISEVWSIQSCSSGKGHFPALDPAPSHFTELLLNAKGGCTSKPEDECPTGLSGPPEGEASSAAQVSGLGSDMLSSKGQQWEAEAFCLGFTFDRSPRLETEPSRRVVAQNIDMRDADQSSSSLVWRGDLHGEGDITSPTSIQEAGGELGTKPHLELLEDPVTSQNDIGIRRLRADFLGSSKEETGTDRKITSLATNQISSVGCVEGSTEEGGSALCVDHDVEPMLDLLPAPTERAVSSRHDAADERDFQEFGEETSVCGCSVVSKRLRERSPPQGVPLVNRLSLPAKKRIRASSDEADDTADPGLSWTPSPPLPCFSRTPSPPQPGLSRTSSPPRLGFSRTPSPPQPGLSRSPPRPGLSWTPSPPRPGFSRTPTPPRPGLSRSPPRPGLSRSPPRPSLSRTPSPSRPGLSQSPSRPGLSQSPSRPGLSQSPSRPGLSQSPSRPGLSQSPPRPGLSQSPSRPGLSQSPSRPGLSQSPSRPGLSQSPSANDERAVISSVIVISDTEDEPLLYPIKEESESDEEAPGHSGGRGAGGVTAAASGFLFSRSAGGSTYPQRGAGIEDPGGASCYRGAPRPSLPESCPVPVALSLSSVLVPSSPAVHTRSLTEPCLDHDSRCLQESKHSGSIGMECHVLSHCEEHSAGFPRQQNSRSPPIAMLHSSRQRSIPPPLTKPQIDPLKPQDQANPPDAQNISLPVQLPLPYSLDDDIFPPPELDYLPDSPECSDHEESWDSSTKVRKPSAYTLGSDFVHHGDRRISDLGPQEGTCLTPECSSDGNCVGSVFLEDQDEQIRASDPSEAAAFRPSPRGLLESSWATSDQDVISQLRECELLLQSVSQTLKVDGIEEAHAKEWKKQIEEMQGQSVPPQTYIAVIGDTGSGKSSLLNALLDEEAVLPTSAMRACTAVAVEVSHNAQNDHYCAEVEFFTEEEWDKELQLLLRDMSDKNGRLKKRRPDPNSEASVAYSRVRAVYGKILPYSELKQIQDVTSHLGRTEIISEAKAMDFLCKVQNFIDSRADDSRTRRGGEFWPIVKRVKVWVPRSPVLRTGAVLVDLPGIRDSNAARNNIAKEYLKNCHAVWIVANVTRAVDDKTARDMLDKNLQRQLFLDGQYGRLAFICTKTDSHNVTEILSALRLTSNCTSLEDEIAELKSQIEQKRTELQAWRLDLEQVEERNAKAKLLGLAIKQQESELNDLQYKMSIKRRELSLNSIKARNIFCRKNIRLNIKCRLQEMKRQARKEQLESEEECEEGSDADDDEEDDCDDDIQPVLAGEMEPVSDRNGNLPVFTVSSTEYLKLQDKLLRDGPAQVFNNIEDTEIPAVQRFVHQITLSRRVVATEMVIRRVATFVSQVVTYLTNRRAQDASYQAQVRGTVRECLFHVKELFQNIAEDCNRQVGSSFSLITAQLKLGKSLAVTRCEHSVHKWGLRPPSGYPYPTYRAACERNGSFTSPACGPVDFNEELTHPMLTLLLEVWDEVFSESVLRSKSLLHHLHKFKAAVQENLQCFFSDLKERLRQIEGDTQPVDYILSQHIPAVEAKLQNFILMLMMDITTRQRGITRILTPSVQEEMIPAYQACQSETGSGSFTRMKSHMEQYVQKHRDHIFSFASQKLTSELRLLQDAIYSGLKHILEEIHTELCVQFEPMLKPVRIIDEIIPRLVSVCARVSVLCQRSHIDFTMPKIEDGEEETGPTMCPTQLIKEESPSLQELPVFLGKAKLMKIGQFIASPTDSVKISLNAVFLSFEVSGFSKQIAMRFQSLVACDYCPAMHFFILYPGQPRSGVSEERSRWDVLVILDEQQTAPGFGEWMDAVCSQTGGSTEFRKLELHHGVERLHSVGVTFQGTEMEAPEQNVRTQTGPRPAFHLASSFVNVSQQSRKRQWNDDVTAINRFTVSPSLLCPSHWSMASHEAQTETQPPVLKREKAQEQGSGFSEDWIDRSQPPVLKQERLEKTKSVEFENH